MPTFLQRMVHEEHRWSYMTNDQLLRRLGRITQTQKLRCFVTMASRRGEAFLEQEAYNRADVLGIDLGRAVATNWVYSERAIAERRRQAQGRIARGGPVGVGASEALSRSMSLAASPSLTSSPSSSTSRSVPTTSQRSTQGGRPTTFSVAEILGPLSIPKSKKKKAVRHIRFSKGDV